MISFLIIWLILLPVCFLIGLLILNICNVSEFTVIDDRFIVSIWLGIIILCLTSITLTLFLPLSPIIGGVTWLIWSLISLFSEKVRKDFSQLLTLLSPQIFIGGLLISIFVAIFNTQQITWFDTGLYHLGSIHWIAKFGAVSGVGLIHSKFGFTSSWFAFSAPLILDWEGGKISAISNGFLMLISFFHILIILNKIKEKKINLPDLFIGIFLLVIMLIYIFDNANGNSLISFSHDIPVALLIGIITWSILVANIELVSSSNQSSLKNYLIPLLLSVGTLSIKLTGIPILLMVFIFYCWKNNINIKKFIIVISFISILLLPNALFSIKTSGCPIYPSEIMCLNLPWTIDKETIKAENSNIIGVKKIEANTNPILGLLEKRIKWLKSSKKIQITVFLYVLSIVLGIVIIRQKKLQFKSIQIWIVCLGILGTTFIMMIVPLIRFGMGYFLLIPSLFIANFLMKNTYNIYNFNKIKHLIKFFIGFILIMIVFLSKITNIQNRLIFPVQLPKLTLIESQNNDVFYRYPADFKIQCWNAELPCSILPIKRNIRLINQQKGIKSGFQFY
jgi:hypothetical protein